MIFRKRITLDGPWQFRFDSHGGADIEEINSWHDWREALVPLPWQAQFEDLRLTSGEAWYRRTIILDEQPTGAAILHFGAVDYHATVWLNGQRIGEHEGGYLPFEFDVAAALHPGENSLVVRAVDPGEDRSRWPAYPFSEIPHGKQSWYGPVGGLWQSVWLELRPPVHLSRLRLTPDATAGSIHVVTAIANRDAVDEFQVQVSVIGPGDDEIETGTLDDGHRGVIQLDPSAVTLWSPDAPALYTVTAWLLVDGQVVDEISDVCGFRTIEAKGGRIYLNGEPIYLRGALDQAYYPGTIYTPPSTAFLEDQARKAKSLGLNCLRCHIKIEDPRYYEVADRLGLLIWTEIPNWAHLSPQAARRAKETFAQMVERDWNHPSIFAWTLVNEDWGTDLTHNAEHRRWLADFYHEAKALDPTRLIVDNSACVGNLHVASDVEDYHYYRAIPDHAAEWDEWVADFAGRAAWAWAEEFAHERRPDSPLLVSEFGNWGLPDPRLIQEDGADPWWFETGHAWGDGIVYPHGMRRRFDTWQLDRVFGDFDRFIRASQEHMARSLAYEIASMRRETAIGGYVITEFTDVHWECNGLLDMQRNVKQGLAEHLTPINQDQVVVIRPQRWSGRPGESIPVEIRAVDVDGVGQQGVVHWRAGDVQGETPAPGGVVQVPLPQDQESGILSLVAEWVADDGTTLAGNQVELAYVTPPTPVRQVQVVDDEELAAALKQLGYPLVMGKAENAAGTVLITRSLTQAVLEKVQAGARLILIAGPDFAASPSGQGLPVGGIVPRAGTSWQGDWATSFSWLRKTGPFAHLPGGPLLEMEYAEVMPDAVIVGVPPWGMTEHSWAGLALGWIHKPVSLLVRVPYGRGGLVVTTFKLTPEILTQNVIAQGLLAGCIELAASSTEP